MRAKVKRFEEKSPVEFLMLRDQLGLGRYKKRVKRSPEEKDLLLELGLKKIMQEEEDDFIPIGLRRRRVRIVSRKK